MFTSAPDESDEMREPAHGRSAPARRREAEARRHVETVTKAAGSSFYWAMRLLPRDRREAMFAVYAFCRAVDDVADGPAPREEKLRRLQEWRAEIDRLYDAAPTGPTTRALRGPVRRFGLRREDFLAVIDGVEMDARQDIAAPTLAELELYCRRVAGAVGLLSIRAFGTAHPDAESFAIALGGALQLTNILRDLKQDAQAGRLYLPRELLDLHGVTARDPDEVLAHPGLAQVCDDLADMAERRFREAEAILARRRDKALRPAVVMMVSYRRLLVRLLATRWRSLDRRVGLPRTAKLWIALRYGLLPDRAGGDAATRGAAPPAGDAGDPQPGETTSVAAGRLDEAIGAARARLAGRQAPDGHWLFELEADATIPAEYILLKHFIGEVDAGVEARLANYLRRIQTGGGGWPLFYGGAFDVSASVKAYFALKLAGDDPAAAHMARAREAILAHGGAARSNVFTRITLALFGQVPWRAAPVMPAEIMLLPRWFPFHLSKVSYWSRTVIVPLLILLALKPSARNPRGVGVGELFAVPPFEERYRLVNPTGARLGAMFLALDRALRALTPLFPRSWRRRAIDAATAFVSERINGEDGLGGIFPAMANALMAFRTLGYADDHPDYARTRRAIERLLVTDGDSGYCQPCLSPVWDTALATLALAEAGFAEDVPSVRSAAGWLRERQVLDVNGDWRERRPALRPGGWPFQYRNDHYPDTDDSAVAVMALDRAGDGAFREAIDRGAEWIVGMQSRNGGWGSFDADNTCHYLNHIPFADHGALLDPPTADVSARCLGMLAQTGYRRDHPAVARAIEFLLREQEEDGSWFGRWGTNYVYGTWSVLCGLNAVGEDPLSPPIRKAVAWLKRRQGEDGGWGEDGASYWPERRYEAKASTASQTAWAVLALMAAGEVRSDAVRRGVDYLLRTLRADGSWSERRHNAVGFPRVFYLRYHGYACYFPLWALARYRRLTAGNASVTPYGM